MGLCVCHSTALSLSRIVASLTVSWQWLLPLSHDKPSFALLLDSLFVLIASLCDRLHNLYPSVDSEPNTPRPHTRISTSPPTARCLYFAVMVQACVSSGRRPLLRAGGPGSCSCFLHRRGRLAYAYVCQLDSSSFRAHTCLNRRPRLPASVSLVHVGLGTSATSSLVW